MENTLFKTAKQSSQVKKYTLSALHDLSKLWGFAGTYLSFLRVCKAYCRITLCRNNSNSNVQLVLATADLFKDEKYSD